MLGHPLRHVLSSLNVYCWTRCKGLHMTAADFTGPLPDEWGADGAWPSLLMLYLGSECLGIASSLERLVHASPADLPCRENCIEQKWVKGASFSRTAKVIFLNLSKPAMHALL